ncbi:MAG: M48 family metallopeptidase [Oscillospiraceae bacterium]|nr:M48 family metallopeptidase [Oscillospiraceae bacterium]
MNKYEYRMIRSNRKTLALEITKDGTLLVRAPYHVSEETINRFILEKKDWIERHQAIGRARRRDSEAEGPLSMDDLRALARQALKILPARVAYYAPKIGVTYGRITIRNQTSRWGSCSSMGNLNFNCLLMLTPPEVQDYVVVHELCHRKEMNHSPQFWAEVAQILPDYETPKRWLNEHGGALIYRMELGGST